jgi:N-acetylglucosamine kinase-like BadF-type ATPase
MSYLIADSGATKTDWLFIDDEGETTQIRTQGLHPSNIEMLEDSDDIQRQVGSLNPARIYFFGAGCGNPVSDETVRRFLSNVFPGADIRIKSDLHGSGKAFFGNGDGVVAVLGTGSISAKISGGSVEKKSAALGFAIGDEGSAADLGKRILKMYYRKSATPETIQFLDEKLKSVEYAEMMNRIYRAGKPNRELAAVAGEVLQYPLPFEVESLISDGFRDFIEYQLSTLNLTGDTPIVFTGKVAEVHQAVLVSELNKAGYQNVEIRYPVIASFRKRIKSGEPLFEQ